MSKRLYNEAEWAVQALITSLNRLSLPDNCPQIIKTHIELSNIDLERLATELGRVAKEAKETSLEDTWDMFWHYQD